MPLAVPARQLAELLLAIETGLALEQLADPGAVSLLQLPSVLGELAALHAGSPASGEIARSEAIMTTTTGAGLDLLRARMAAAIGGRMAGHIERLGWGAEQLAGTAAGAAAGAAGPGHRPLAVPRGPARRDRPGPVRAGGPGPAAHHDQGADDGALRRGRHRPAGDARGGGGAPRRVGGRARPAARRLRVPGVGRQFRTARRLRPDGRGVRRVRRLAHAPGDGRVPGRRRAAGRRPGDRDRGRGIAGALQRHGRCHGHRPAAAADFRPGDLADRQRSSSASTRPSRPR